MKIVGGNGQGTDNEKTRIIEIEDGDVDRHISVYAQVREEGGVDLWLGYQGDKEALDDPVERGENLPAPFWVKPQAKPQAAEKGIQGSSECVITGNSRGVAAETWASSREDILKALDGQIGDAEAAIHRHANQPYKFIGGYWKGARDSLINCKRMIEREAKHA